MSFLWKINKIPCKSAETLGGQAPRAYLTARWNVSAQIESWERSELNCAIYTPAASTPFFCSLTLSDKKSEAGHRLGPSLNPRWIISSRRRRNKGWSERKEAGSLCPPQYEVGGPAVEIFEFFLPLTVVYRQKSFRVPSNNVEQKWNLREMPYGCSLGCLCHSCDGSFRFDLIIKIKSWITNELACLMVTSEKLWKVRHFLIFENIFSNNCVKIGANWKFLIRRFRLHLETE